MLYPLVNIGEPEKTECSPKCTKFMGIDGVGSRTVTDTVTLNPTFDASKYVMQEREIFYTLATSWHINYPKHLGCTL